MKYIIWSVIVISCYAYAQFSGYYLPSVFSGHSWKKTGQTLNHK